MSNQLVSLDNFNASGYNVAGASLASTIASFGNNRITLKNGHFRMMVDGVEVQATAAPIAVFIEGFNQYQSRMFYEGAYDPKAESTRPACYSEDGNVPSANAINRQSATCQLCPNNVKDLKGQKACKTFKRVVVTLANDPKMTPYQLDVAAMGLFGDDRPAEGLYNLKSYAAMLEKRGVPVGAVITQISADMNASVSKMFFKPLSAITAELFNARQSAKDKVEFDNYVKVDIGNTGSTERLSSPTAAKPAQLPAPTAAQPVAAQPVAAQPVAAQPVAAQPAAAQPVAAQPVAAQPVAAQPTAAQPVAAQPVAAQPATSLGAPTPNATSTVITSVEDLMAAIG